MTLRAWGAAALLAMFAALSWSASRRDSATFDEPLHIAAGVAYWQSGRPFMDPINTPLMRLWAALPLLARPLPPLSPPPRWVVEERIAPYDYLMHLGGIPARELLDPARAMVLLLGLVLGWGLWRWVGAAAGPDAALGALWLFVFCPPLIAFSHLATSDFPSAAASVASLALAWRWARAPSGARALAFGAAVGAGAMVKLNGAAIGPLAAAAAWLEARGGRTPPAPRTAVTHLGLAAVGAALAAALAYRVTELGALLRGLGQLAALLSGDPSQHFRGVTNTGAAWPWFFAACLALKTPLPILALPPAAATAPPGARAFVLRWLLLPGAAYLALASAGQGQFGVRRILLLYPLLCAAGGAALASLWAAGGARRGAAAVLAGALAVETLAVHPRHLAYFNIAAGGPAAGHRWLVDSNLDWGQGLGSLAAYLRERGAGAVYLAYHGGDSPAAAGIRYAVVDPQAGAYLRQAAAPPDAPEHERQVLLAVSVTMLQGAVYGGRDPFAWLRGRRPAAVVADSIWVYDLSADGDGRRRASAMALSR